MIENITKLAADMEADVIGYRRELHRIPEISYQLPRTSAYVGRKVRRREDLIP